MEDLSNNEDMREEFLFQHLVAMFQTLALQQLGKFMNPITGELERDLHQAKITIDMIAMIQQRTAGNLTPNEKRLLDGVLVDLQMNYVDEMKVAEEKEEEQPGDLEKGAEGEKKQAERVVDGASGKEESGGKSEQEESEPGGRKRESKKGKKKKE